MTSKTELIRLLEESHAIIELLVSQIDSNQEIYPEWTIREVLAHFTGWDDAVITSLKSHAAGGIPQVAAPRGPDFYNEATVTERESLSFERIYQEWQYSHEQLKISIRELPPEKMTEKIVFPWGQSGTVEDLVMGLTSGHEMSHAADIRAVIQKTNPVTN